MPSSILLFFLGLKGIGLVIKSVFARDSTSSSVITGFSGTKSVIGFSGLIGVVSYFGMFVFTVDF